MPLSQFAKERIFAPLEMNDTRFQANYGNIIKDRAYLYVPSGDGAYRYDALSYSTYGPSSLFSTVGDLARWDENFYTAKVGGPSVVRALQEKGKLNDGKELDYASGLVIGEYRGAKTVSHSGADAGYKANIVRFPDYHFTVIVLANAGDLDVDGIPLKIADICLAGTLAPAEAAPDGYPPIVKTEVKLEPQALDALLGDFELEPGFIISFTRENGVLFQQATGQAKFALYPSSPNTFFLKVADAEYVFGEVAADGKIHDATLHQNGHSYPLKRLDPFSLTQDELRTHSGAFYSEELGVIYFIREKNGMLSVRYPRGDILLKQTGVNSFLGAFPIGTLKFLCDPNEDCKGFEVDDGRVRNLKFTKINVPAPGTER